MKTISILTTVVISSVLFFGTTVQAQQQEKNSKVSNSTLVIDKVNYRTAIGLRAGGTTGLTVKHFTGSGNAIEGILGIWPSAFSITGIYEWYVPEKIIGLNWYYGVGAHVAFETGSGYYYYSSDGRYFYRVYRDGNSGLGIDGMLGIEYNIPPIPFAVSIELKPFLEVNADGKAYLFLDPGLGIKVTF